MWKTIWKNLRGGGESFAELFFPLLGYHTRWKELTEEDFCAGSREHYFAKGGQIFSSVAGGISDDEMNAITDELLRNTVKEVYEYDGTEASEWQEENILYSSNVVESNIEWVLKMKEMCEENQISLLAVKVPDVYAPQTYHSAWTGEKYDRTRAFCEEYGIPYYDLLYDTDIGLRYEKDSNDGGMHLNLYGAQKVSLNLGQYLKEQYDLPDGHCEQWDRDLLSYQKVRKTAFLEMEQDFPAYIRMLANEYKEDTVFIAASDDMSQGLNEADINALRELGLQADYSRGGQHAYLAVIEEGEIKYEAMSNRPLNYSGVCGKSEKGYELYSSGWWTDPWASIRLDGQEYAVNVRGLNIVVYDDERGLVLDSVCFDTCAEYHTPVRNNGMINGLEEQFEKYMMEQEGR